MLITELAKLWPSIKLNFIPPARIYSKLRYAGRIEPSASVAV